MSVLTARSMASYLAGGRDVNYNRPHHVYRAFDSYGHLLYVGCSLTVANRIKTHRTSAPWFRYAETIAIAGPWDRREALDRERAAIETEGPYFNCSYADSKRTQANSAAAQRAMDARGDVRTDDSEGSWQRWYVRFEAERQKLKASTYPYLTDEDRLARYLAAREDAELARIEAAA